MFSFQKTGLVTSAYNTFDQWSAGEGNSLKKRKSEQCSFYSY